MNFGKEKTIERKTYTDKLRLEIIESNLINLIRNTTHSSALEGLTTCLKNVRYTTGCLNGEYFTKKDVWDDRIEENFGNA